MDSHYLYRFGPFSLDTRERLLFRDGSQVALKPKAVDTLLLLLRESPRVVEKKSFMEEVWPDAYVEEGSLTVSISEIRKALGQDPGCQGYIETIPRRGYRFAPEPHRERLDGPAVRVAARQSGGETDSAATPAGTIAVLPFANHSSDPTLDYLADGFAESIINSLSGLGGLRVKASGSSFRFRGLEAECPRVCRALGVSALVTGRVLRFSDRLVVRVALVAADDGAQLWGEQYDRQTSDLLEVQGEIAAKVAGQLRQRLTGDEERRLVKRSTDNLDAYRAYLEGRYFWGRRPQAGFMKGIDCFRRAVELDPGYALAYAGLADAYGVLGSWEAGLLSPRDAAEKARGYSTKALELDEGLAEAHTSLAYVLLHYDWDWAGAERGFTRALELKPSYIHAHHWYSHLCVATGRAEKGYELSMVAVDLDPLDLIINVHLSWHHWMTRNPSQALRECARAGELEPNSLWPYFFCGLAYEQQGLYADAVGQLRRAWELSEGTTFALAGQGHALGQALDRPGAESVLRNLEERSDSEYVPPYDMAMVHLGLGDADKALDFLDAAYEERSSWMAYLNVEPRLDPLRGHPRFAGLVQRVGLLR